LLVRQNPDSFQEFQILNSNFIAALERSRAQVIFVPQSGTKGFAGNVFKYYRTP
jgi:hypothetical protein